MNITEESITVDASEPNFVSVHYIQMNGAIDMGGRLRLERKNVPLIIALLHAYLNIYALTQTECQAGHDSFRLCESGPEQEPIINIFNRRPEGVLHSGLSGLMMTKAATQDLLGKLAALEHCQF